MSRDHDSTSAESGEEAPLLSSSASTVSAHSTGKDSKAANQHVTPIRAYCIIASLGILVFLQACNFSALTTTQSAIAADLDAFAQVSWFTSAYLIAMGSMSPLLGRLSQIFSARSCVLVSALIFSLGTFVTSQAANLAMFLVGRAVTGIGAAGILNLAIILTIELSSKRYRGLFIGLVNTGYTLGVSLGAVIAGALVAPVGWRALFWIQSPFTVVAGICIFISIPKTFTTSSAELEKQTIVQKLARVDYAGALLLVSSIVLLLFSLSSQQILPIPILLSLVLFTGFILNETYLAASPLIPLTLLRSRATLFTCLAQLGFMTARWTILFYTPVYALSTRLWSPALAGTILIPTNAGFALGGLLAGYFHIRRTGSFYTATLVVMAIFPATMMLLAYLSTPTTPVAIYIAATALNGLVTGAGLNYTLAHLLHLTPPSTHFVATSLLATFRLFAGSFGSAVGGGIFTRILKRNSIAGFAERGMDGEGELVRKLLGSPALVKNLHGAEKEVAVDGYVAGLEGLFWAASALAIVVVLVQAGSGWRKGREQNEMDEDEERNRAQ